MLSTDTKKRVAYIRTRANKSEKEEGNSDDILQQIKQIFKRKVKIPRKKRRQIQSKKKRSDLL